MSNGFERVYQIDPSREKDHQREKHTSIELSDHEHLIRLGCVPTGHYVKFNDKPHFDDEPLKVSKEMEQEGWVYKEPPPEDAMSPALKEKFKKARKICQDTKVVTINGSEAPKIEMPIDPDILTKYKFSDDVVKGKKNERKKGKAPAKRTKKANTKSNEPAVADVQEKLQ